MDDNHSLPDPNTGATGMSSKQRQRLVMLAYCCAPKGTMEQRNGWHRALQAAREFDVTVLCYPFVSIEELQANLPKSLQQGSLRFELIHSDWLCRVLYSCESLFYFFYRRWNRLALRRAQQIHQTTPFSLAHFVTLCGFREPGELWKLGVPHIWGPIGGTSNFPSGFAKLLSTRDRIREWVRGQINSFQLRCSRRVRNAALRSSVVIAATHRSKAELAKGIHVPMLIDLETGLDYPSIMRPPRVQHSPLNILWSGRLRAWKAFPILLYAVAKLPSDVPYRIRVLGIGSSQMRWLQLAKQLGVSERIEWIPWPETYQETHTHYVWADVFAFTSLRDTSGSGLLESLAAGTPIIGVDHQGAADIMNDQCAIRVPVSDLTSTIEGFATAIERLYRLPDIWLQLSRGATKRSNDFQWNNRESWMLGVYRQAIDQ
jgi:glycosyltransferase involved in cell wall biosynthesis